MIKNIETFDELIRACQQTIFPYVKTGLMKPETAEQNMLKLLDDLRKARRNKRKLELHKKALISTWKAQQK